MPAVLLTDQIWQQILHSVGGLGQQQQPCKTALTKVPEEQKAENRGQQARVEGGGQQAEMLYTLVCRV